MYTSWSTGGLARRKSNLPPFNRGREKSQTLPGTVFSVFLGREQKGRSGLFFLKFDTRATFGHWRRDCYYWHVLSSYRSPRRRVIGYQ